MKYKLASTYIKALAEVSRRLKNDFYIKHITYNSKEVKPNSLFVVKGETFKMSYLYEAIKKGANFIVLSADFIKKNSLLNDKKFMSFFNDDKTIFLIVDDLRDAMLKIVDIYYSKAYKKLKLIGITGTKGKTTTAYYLHNVLNNNKISSGLITSIKNFNGKKSVDALLTTPEIFELHKFFYECVKNNLKYVIMEVSSQALKYERIKGLNFFIGIFLNISNDHISEIEHTDIDDYLLSKLKLGEISEYFLVNKNLVIPNLSKNSSEVSILKMRSLLNTKKHNIKYFKTSFKTKLLLKQLSKFNIENASSVVAATSLINGNITEKNICDVIVNTTIEGRNEIYRHENRIIIVDYAHNGASFKAILNYANSFKKKESVLVFGATGTKGKNRRIDIAKEAALFRPSKIYLTEDDPGFEDPNEISKSIYSLIINNNQALKDKITFIKSRKQTIKTAIEKSNSDSIILILGKGNDCFMVRKGRKMKYEGDPQIVKACLKEMESNKSIKKLPKKTTKTNTKNPAKNIAKTETETEKKTKNTAKNTIKKTATKTVKNIDKNKDKNKDKYKDKYKDKNVTKKTAKKKTK